MADSEHIPDHYLLMDVEGELEGEKLVEVRRHVDGCATCRQRQVRMQASLAVAVEAHLAQPVPPAAQPLRVLAPLYPPGWQRYLAVACLGAALILVLAPWKSHQQHEPEPLGSLTPGAVTTISRDAMCAAPAETEGPAISQALALEVFRRYGIENPEPRAYEIDYLIPPDLGGSADPKNLWPQPYKEGVWNSRVKDALEDRLRTLVCNGSLDLALAQEEISSDWIGAYRKHFATEKPLPDHVAFVKDRPWE